MEEETRPDYVVLTLALNNEEKTTTPQDTPQDAPQDANKTIRKKQRVKMLLEFCREPRSLTDMMEHIGLKDRKSFIEGYINPLLAEGAIAMTEPDKRTSGNQQYVVVKGKQ